MCAYSDPKSVDGDSRPPDSRPPDTRPPDSRPPDQMHTTPDPKSVDGDSRPPASRPPDTRFPDTRPPETREVLQNKRNLRAQVSEKRQARMDMPPVFQSFVFSPAQDAPVSTSQLELRRPTASQILESVNGGEDFVGSRQVDHTCMYI